MTDCVYICSAGHSGSTLLDLLIGSHSRAVSLGEISHFPKNIALNTQCTCGEAVQNCEVWRDIIDKLSQKLSLDLETDPYRLNLGPFKAHDVVDNDHQTRWRMFWQGVVAAFWYADLRFNVKSFAAITAHARRGVENNFALYDTVGDVRGIDKVVDSSKSYFKAAQLYKTQPTRVKIILLVRDGRAVMYSAIKKGVPRELRLKAWRNLYRRALPILSRNVDSKDILRVHYEDLANNPEAELKRICRFIGLMFEPQMLKFMEQTHHVTNGNDMRFGSDSAIKLDDSWKGAIAADDLAYFEKRAGPLNKELGYD